MGVEKYFENQCSDWYRVNTEYPININSFLSALQQKTPFGNVNFSAEVTYRLEDRMMRRSQSQKHIIVAYDDFEDSPHKAIYYALLIPTNGKKFDGTADNFSVISFWNILTRQMIEEASEEAYKELIV